jgi:hypothetical protein
MASSSAALNAPAATAMRSLWCRHHSQRGLRLRCVRRHEASAHGRPIIITATNRRLEVEVSREGLGVSGALGFGWEQDVGVRV